MKGKCDPYVDKKSPKLKSSPFSFLRQYGSLPIIGNYLSGIPLHHKPIVEVVLVSILQGNITLLDWGNFFMNKFTPKWRCRKSSVINSIFSQYIFFARLGKGKFAKVLIDLNSSLISCQMFWDKRDWKIICLEKIWSVCKNNWGWCSTICIDTKYD